MALTDSTAGTAAQQMGQQLRQTRETAGLDVDAVATRLRIQKNLIRALEEGDWSRLGASIFVRGHLRSYARLLGIELAGLDEITQTPPAPVIPMVRIGRGRQWFGRLGTQLVYVVITALIGVPIWMAAQRHLSTSAQTMAIALDIPKVQPPVSPAPDADEAADPSEIQTFAPSVAQTPPSHPFAAVATASLIPSPVPETASSDITLQLSQDSWVELYAPDGRNLEQNLLKAGEVRRFAHGQLGQVVIGNVQGATLRIGGKVQDLSAWQRANVARFAVSSDGLIGPISD